MLVLHWIFLKYCFLLIKTCFIFTSLTNVSEPETKTSNLGKEVLKATTMIGLFPLGLVFFFSILLCSFSQQFFIFIFWKKDAEESEWKQGEMILGPLAEVYLCSVLSLACGTSISKCLASPHCILFAALWYLVLGFWFYFMNFLIFGLKKVVNFQV